MIRDGGRNIVEADTREEAARLLRRHNAEALECVRQALWDSVRDGLHPRGLSEALSAMRVDANKGEFPLVVTQETTSLLLEMFTAYARGALEGAQS